MSIARFQPGFRLMDGTAMNIIVNQTNANTVSGGSVVQTALTTVGAGTILATALLSGLVVRSGPGASFTDTTYTGAAIDAALGVAAVTGQAVIVQYKNTTAFAATIVGGTGVTVSGRTVVTPNSLGSYLLTRTGIGTYTFFGIDVSPQAVTGVDTLLATADNGTTQTLTTAMIVGGNALTYHQTLGGTTPSLTLPLGTDMDLALPDMRIGQGYTLRIINTNSGTATIVTNTGWTLTGTLTIATNTWREFIVTKTGTGTYSGVQVGTGTTS